MTPTGSLTLFDLDCSTCVREAKEEAEAEAKKQCDKKNLKDHSFVPYDHHQCWLCSATPSRHPKYIDSPDRIATLHEWQAQDQKTIQSLNESNQKLSEKIAQLEKEKHELTQKLETVVLDSDIDLHRLGFDARCVDCVKGRCNIGERPANRKA